MDMQLNKNQKSLINKVIEGWERADLIDVDMANKLKEFDTVQEIDWAKLSKYSFWLAIASIIIAIGTLFADKWIISAITYIFEAPKIVLSLLFVILSSLTFYFGWKFEKKNPQIFLHNLYTVIGCGLSKFFVHLSSSDFR